MDSTFREDGDDLSKGKCIKGASKQYLIIPCFTVHGDVASVQKNVFGNRITEKGRFRPIMKVPAMREGDGYLCMLECKFHHTELIMTNIGPRGLHSCYDGWKHYEFKRS